MWELWALSIILLTVIFAFLYDDGKYTYILIIALLFRFVLIPIFPMISQADVADYLPYFTRFSNLLLNDGLFSALREYVTPHVPFYTVLYPGYIYSVFGDQGLVLIRIFNACLSIFVFPILNELNKIIFNISLKRWQALFILSWPSYLFYSVEVGRTVPSVIFVSLAIYAFFLLVTDTSIQGISLFLFSSISVIMVRVFYAVYVFGIIGLTYLYKVYLSDQKYMQFLSTIAILAVSYYLGLHLFPHGELSIDQINSLAQGIAHGGSAYLTTVYPTSFIDLVWYVPLQGVYFQFSPFVWDVFRISNPLTIVAFLQSTLLLIFIAFTLMRMQSQIINWKFVLVILLALAVPLTLGIGVKNTGAAVRWRVPTDMLILSLTSTIVDYEFLSDDTG